MAKNYIENVAIVGAGGNSGKYMVESLLATGKHAVTAITRADSLYVNEAPSAVHVKKVDYENESTLVDALKGQDALIITMGVTAPPGSVEKLIEAAAKANVPWVLPNEWGMDKSNEQLGKDTFIGEQKKAQRELIEKLGVSSWIGVATSFWYEWSLAFPWAYGFDFANRAVTLYDDGETKINTTTWPQVGRGVAALLSLKVHPDGDSDALTLEKFKNNFYSVSSFYVSQKDMLDSVLRVTKTKLDDWKITKEPSHERYAAGLAEFQKGDRMGFGKLLYARCLYPDGSGTLKDVHNDLLGLPKEDLDEFTEKAIKRSENPFA